MANIGRLDDSFLDNFLPQASPEEGQSLQQKEEQREKKFKVLKAYSRRSLSRPKF